MIEALRKRTPSTTIEILTPDFRNKSEAAVEEIVAAGPRRLQSQSGDRAAALSDDPAGARYYASLRLLESVKRKAPHIFTKSGLMVGLGEQRLEVHQVMDDMRSAGVDFLTMGQYLQPTPRHARVEEFVTPQGVRCLCGDRPCQGLPAGRRIAADPVELSCRRRLRENAGGNARRSWSVGEGAECRGIARPSIYLTRPSNCSTSSPMLPVMTSSCRGWSRSACDRRARQETVADLVVGFNAFKERFTSRVVKERPSRICVDYVEGPLKYLHNEWHSSARADGGTDVCFSVDFAFKSRLFETLAGSMFDRALRRMTSAFEQRAAALYGISRSSAQSAA